MNDIDINNLNLVYEDNKTIVVLSPNHDQSPMNLPIFYTNLKKKFLDVIRFNKQRIHLRNGSIIHFMAILSPQMRGVYPHRIIIVNEHKINKKRLLMALTPLMRDKPDIKKWVW